MSEPYSWGGAGPSDCTGDIAKRARQRSAGKPIEDIMQSIAADYSQIINRTGRDNT